MNEKVAKKIGEAYAFAEVFGELALKFPVLMKELFLQDSANIRSATDLQKGDLDKIISASGMADVVKAKVEKTSKKITEMGEFYVGDAWDDPAEVLEWMSFFLGAAVIHWQLIVGCGKGLPDNNLGETASKGASYYAGLLEVAREKAESIGLARAQKQ
jgi:hypothetical protein